MIREGTPPTGSEGESPLYMRHLYSFDKIESTF